MSGVRVVGASAAARARAAIYSVVASSLPSGSRRDVAAALVSFGGDCRRVVLCYSRLAEACGWSVRTVMRSVFDLEVLGALSVVRLKSSRGDCWNLVNSYRLDVSRLVPLAGARRDVSARLLAAKRAANAARRELLSVIRGGDRVSPDNSSRLFEESVPSRHEALASLRACPGSALAAVLARRRAAGLRA